MDIFISAWNFRKHIERGKIKLSELGELAVKNGFAGIEVMDRQLPLDDIDFLERFAKGLRRMKCGLILDVSSDLTYADEEQWQEQIQYVRNCLRIAKEMWATKVRILLGGQAVSFQKMFTRTRKIESATFTETGSYERPGVFQRIVGSSLAGRASHNIRKGSSAGIRKEQQKIERAILALQEIIPEAERLDLPVVIENHWGISSRPQNIVQIVRKIKSEYLGTCPDFDNFPRDVDRYDGIKLLSHRALHVHAKSMKFDNRGEEKNIDYGRCMSILRQARYKGAVTIEYEGHGDVLRGCLMTGNLILRHWKRCKRKSIHSKNRPKTTPKSPRNRKP